MGLYDQGDHITGQQIQTFALDDPDAGIALRTLPPLSGIIIEIERNEGIEGSTRKLQTLYKVFVADAGWVRQ